MRYITASMLLIFAIGAAEAGEVGIDLAPSGLAHWLLASRQPTEPLPSPQRWVAPPVPPPDGLGLVGGDLADRLFASPAPAAADIRGVYPAPPETPPTPWAMEYAHQYSPDAHRRLALLPPPDDDANRLHFAGGAITLQVPAGWSVSEADFPRHVRLYITPVPLADVSSLCEGVWISYHVTPSRSSEQDLQDFMKKQTARDMPHDARIGRIELAAVNEHLSLKQSFVISTGDLSSAHGYHLLVAADWGIVELHARFASDQSQQLISRMIAGMSINQPRAGGEVASDIADARPIVGAWKAERARLILSAEGTIELAYDSQRPQQLDHAHLTRPTRRLLGEYEAADDVLYVTWKDGSRLNLRWSASPGKLLLTDHQGRISQLQRLFE